MLYLHPTEVPKHIMEACLTVQVEQAQQLTNGYLVVDAMQAIQEAINKMANKILDYLRGTVGLEADTLRRQVQSSIQEGRNNLFVMPIQSLQGLSVEELAAAVRTARGKLPLDVFCTAKGVPCDYLTVTQRREACYSDGFLLCVGSQRLAKLAFMAVGSTLTYQDTSSGGGGPGTP